MTQLSEHLTAEENLEYLGEFLTLEGAQHKNLADAVLKYGAFMWEKCWLIAFEQGDDNGYIRASEESKER